MDIVKKNLQEAVTECTKHIKSCDSKISDVQKENLTIQRKIQELTSALEANVGIIQKAHDEKLGYLGQLYLAEKLIKTF
jgi:chaperonin cofactor prefoldin